MCSRQEPKSFPTHKKADKFITEGLNNPGIYNIRYFL